jgi:hypothetical protein
MAPTPTELQQFIRKARRIGPEKLQEALRDALGRGDLRLRDDKGEEIDSRDLNLASFRADIPEDFSEDSEIHLRVERKNGEVITEGFDLSVQAPLRQTGPPGMRGFLWTGELPTGPRMCPRCGDTWIPLDEAPGEYPGAMSRVRVGRSGAEEYATRSVEICSPCGQDEAMGRGVIPIEDWPIGKGEHYYGKQFFVDAMSDALKSGRLRLQNEETGEPWNTDNPSVELVGIDGDEVKLSITNETEQERT